MKFTAKTDLAFCILLSVTFLMMLIIGLLPLLELGSAHIGAWILLVVMWGLSFFFVWMWRSTVYMIGLTELIIRYGPFKKIIPLAAITKVMPVKSLVSSAALSYSRLEILYGKWDTVHISPLKQEDFLSLLRERCPQADIID